MLILAYDLGATKLAVGVINSKAKILKSLKFFLDKTGGKKSVLNQLVTVGEKLIAEFPRVSRIGIASAGPLHVKRGVLISPTNMMVGKKSIGVIPVVSFLKNALKLPVYLENDAAASILAEHWVGAAKGYKNAMILTLGTGLGTAVLVDGKLIRAGRGLHTEAGHLIFNPADKTAPCGCGNFGCAEAYLSGKNFENRFYKKHGLELSATEIAILAKKREKKAVFAFQEYAYYLALAIHNYVVVFSPEIILLTGSFAQVSPLFLYETKRHLRNFLIKRRSFIDQMPEIKNAGLGNNAGLIGGAYIAFKS
ncbi:MAG: ROK family protein [Bdellovibrio sp.]|nr:ROK family protein [Bdellovibrio sp.]